jgi:YidC/Oxa1 family membrane protein insertase
MTSLQKSPEWVELNRKYKDDKQKLQQEQMALYKTMGINPFGSCLPTLIQFPIIIGLYQSITRALAVTPVAMVDLSRHVYPFIDISSLLPINQKFLWMDLSQPERLYIFGIGIPVLAIIVVATTFLQSKLMAMPSATPGEQGAQMTKMMNLYMPVLMGWLALTFASGLSLYFVTSNVVTIGQYGAMGKLNLDSLMFWRKPKPVDTKGVIDGKMVNKPKLVTDGKPVVESKPAGGKSTSTNKPSGGSKPLTPKKKKR